MFDNLPASSRRARGLFRAGIPAALIIHGVVAWIVYASGTPPDRESSQAAPGPVTLGEPGTLDVDVPDTLRLGREYVVQLRLLPPPERDTTGPRSVRISNVRQASLTGRRLLVESRAPPLQLLDSVSPVEWVWVITPTEVGPQQIRLELDGIVERGGKQTTATLYAAQREIVVVASPDQRIAAFAARNWWWLWMLALLPGIPALRSAGEGDPLLRQKHG